MQIPTEWYVHIVPGALILVGVLFLLGTKTRKGLSDLMARQAIGSTVAIVVCAYIIGFVENAIILFGIRPLLNHITSVDPPTAHSIAEWTTFHRTASSHIIETLGAGYQNMVFSRSLLGALIVFLVCLLISLHFPSYRVVKFWIIIFCFVALPCVYCQWRDVRASHLQFTSEVLSHTESRHCP
jgi:hypothetical protein